MISHLPSTELTVENSVINGSVLEGVYIENDEESTIRIINSSITTSGGRAVCDNTDGSTVFVSGSTFSGNKFGTFLFYPAFKYLSTPSPCTVLFQSNHFIGNQRPTVDVRSKGSWVFLNNTFQKNRGISVISFQKVDSLVSLDVDGNLFMANQCPGKAVITVGGRVYSNEVVIRNNNFTLNSGRCVHFTDRTKRIPVSITNNVFHENYCEDKSVIEVLQMDENATFVGNVFTQNSAESVVLFEVMQDIHSSLQRKKVVFNNTLINNIAYTSSPMTIADDSCALVLYGVPSYREIHFGFNKFNNPKYQRELCVRFPALSTRDVVNVSHNWWGTVIDNEVRDRISDFDDNYDFAIADYWPFLLSNDGTASNTVEQRDFKQHGNVLSGRLFESITLKASHSPYSVTSDLTVLDNVTLTIEAGVTVTVSPGMSILVAGALQARGKPDKPVVFTVKEPAGSNKGSQIPLRLVDGDFPWEGRVEVFYNKSWTPVYSSNITTTTEVVCRQLGYGSPVAAVGNSEAFRRTVNEGWLTEFLCLGNETFIHECPTKRLPLNYIRMLGVVAKCQSAPWGNLRFVSSRDASVSQMPSVLKHVEFSHSGSRHGMSVPAIEAVENVPKLKSISIRNCLSGGLRIYSPRANVHVNNSTFVNTGQVGLSFVQTRRNILVESTESSRNQRGLSFEETSAQNVPRVHYGRVSLCSDETVVFVENQAHVYFDLQRPKDALLWLTCQKVIKVTRGRGIKLTLLYFKGTQWQKLEIYDSNITSNLIVSEWTKYMASLVHKEFFIPRDTILIRWTAGDVSTEVVFLTEAINIKGGYFCEVVFLWL